ncbi:phage resistance protein [Streptococcus suis]|nr:phage resistance protein [Streptococcus suis]
MAITDDLKTLVDTDWKEAVFGKSKMKADYKKQIDQLVLLDEFNKVHYKNHETFIPEGEVMYTTEISDKVYKFIAADLKIIENKEKKTSRLQVSYRTGLTPFAKLVIDYLLGRLTFYNNKLYDVNDKQAVVLDDYTIKKLYNFRNEGEYVLEILEGIHKTLNIKAKRRLEPHKILGQDFVIDLKKHTMTRISEDNHSSYFKYYDVSFNKAIESVEMAVKFLKYVIADKDSYHNAQLQAYYIAQVASGLHPKLNFFISKSDVRTGKGLRHIALSGLFNKVEVELDNLTGSAFEASNAWAMFAGGEMALATEQGDIMGDKMERVLKIIATEKPHLSRLVGQNYGLIDLTSVLCIDTNKKVLLSDEMNGRKVLIQYQDRPKGETDLQRHNIFAPFWEAFTNPDKSPNIEGSIGFLIASMEYFKEQGCQFEFRDVELKNDIELNDYLLYLIEALDFNEFILKDDVIEALKFKVYGANKNKMGDDMKAIGVKSFQKKVNGRVRQAYRIDNHKRFNSAKQEIEEELDRNVSLEDIFEKINNGK